MTFRRQRTYQGGYRMYRDSPILTRSVYRSEMLKRAFAKDVALYAAGGVMAVVGVGALIYVALRK